MKQLNNEKLIAKTVRLQNGQLLLIVGLHMQMQSQSKKEIKLLKTIIKGIRLDTRISNVVIYGDFNLNLSNRKNKKMIEKLEAFLACKTTIPPQNWTTNTGQEMKFERFTKTQVDFFISSIQNDKILSVSSI